MTFKLPGRILETFVTTGTGTITLDGAVAGYKTFSSELSNADTCHYFMFGGSDYEEGYGTYSGGTLARTTVLRSSNSNNAVSWLSGTKYVGIGPLGPSDLDAANLRRLWSAMGIADRRVRAATTADITISTALNNGDTLDGVTLATGDRVLVKNQSTASQNGIYIVGTTPARAEDYATWDPHVAAIISVAEGTANADTLWLCTSNTGGTLGSTSLAFSRVNNAAGIANTPAGGIAAATVQAAIDELDTEKVAKVASTDNGLPRFDGTGGVLQTSLLFVEDLVTLADDTAISFATSGQGELCWIVTTGVAAPSPRGSFFVRAATPECSNIGMVNTTNISFGTSALSGTTGSDGNFNIAATSGNIYFENRAGSSRSFSFARLKTT